MRNQRFATALIILTAALVCGPGALAHPDDDWLAARSMLLEFANAVATGDVDTAASHLQEQFGGAPRSFDRDGFLRMVGNSPGRLRIELRYAFHEIEDSIMRVTPVILFRDRPQQTRDGRSVITMELVKVEDRWMIADIQGGAELPLELQQQDDLIDLPEHHGYRQVKDGTLGFGRTAA